LDISRLDLAIDDSLLIYLQLLRLVWCWTS